MKTQYKKILILGSGALKIGQAGEFDYSGSQAIKAFKEEGIKTVLINPNIATIQTSRELADIVYFLPVTPDFVGRIIEKEKPDGIALSFGGQTALNCGIELYESGILKKYNVKIIGTPISAIILTEDREKFARHLKKISIPTPGSQIATNIKDAEILASSIGFPLMIRAGFALGGQGSGIAKNMIDLKHIVTNALAFTPHVLIEQYLHHYKEVEYEVVRDKDDNCITVCNMENMDPLGIHTGESIVIAPSQTLNNEEYHGLREASIKIVKSLGIVGECNVQFALNPKSFEYFVIEVNARLSRSSALASKATGYPLAYVAAKLGLGYNLTQLKNKVTGVTAACFEPSLDYVVVKMPRWDIEKFKGADERIGSSMKSVGEVMGIGRTFEEAYQKAIRMLDLDYEGATSEKIFDEDKQVLDQLNNPTPKRMFAVAKALKRRMSIKKIYKLTGIDPWFLYRIKNIVDEEDFLREYPKLTKEKLLSLKQIGFSDRRIGELIGKTGLEIREIRKKYNILPSVFQIDTLGAEFPAKTNYLYLTYNGNHDDVKPLEKNAVVVLGSGPYRIGSSVEFDWTNVMTVAALKTYKKDSIVINCNPETVSTDYDISDRLYFEELTFERIADICDFENPMGVIVSVGGQTPNNRAKALKKYGFPILGTDPENIDKAENRSKFSHLLDTLSIKQPAWKQFSTFEEAEKFAEDVGLPVLIRPSYVLSGSAMNVCYTNAELRQYLEEASIVSKEYPVTVSKFFEKSREVEYDAIAKDGEVKISAISEHVENAGVHSGDATVVFPSQTIPKSICQKIEITGKKLAESLSITGPFNIQFLVKDNEIYVIELNARASRTFPFVSKVSGINFMKLFVDCLFQKNVSAINIPQINFIGVKVPQFSFSRLTGADPILRVEMASTGEVACFGTSVEKAYLKGLLSVGGTVPKKGIFVSLGGDEKKKAFLKSAKNLSKLSLPIYATENTAKFLESNGISTRKLYKIHENKSPNILTYFREGKIDLAINIVDQHFKKDLNDDFIMRRSAIDNNIFLTTKISQANLLSSSLARFKTKPLSIHSWNDYTK